MIESDPLAAEEIRDSFDVLVINDSALSVSSYELASTISSDLFIAVMGNDTENIVACLLAKEHGAKRTIASGVQILYLKLKMALMMVFKLTLYFPENLNCTRTQSVTQLALAVRDQFASGTIEATRIKLSESSSWIGYSIQDIKLPEM